MIRVLVVDDNISVRLGLKALLEVCDDMELVGEAANGQQALLLCQQLQPNVVLMDVHMPIMDGITATSKIVKQYPNIHVVILTYSPGVTPQQAMQAGASVVMTKTVSIDTLAKAIRSVAA